MYDKQKEERKEERAKYREKVQIDIEKKQIIIKLSFSTILNQHRSHLMKKRSLKRRKMKKGLVDQ